MFDSWPFWASVVFGLPYHWRTISPHSFLKVVLIQTHSILCVFAQEPSSFTLVQAGPGMASRLFVMSPNLLLAPPLIIRFSVSREKPSSCSRWTRKQPSCVKRCTYTILHSVAHTFNCRKERERQIIDQRGTLKVTFSLSFWQICPTSTITLLIWYGIPKNPPLHEGPWTGHYIPASSPRNHQ